MARIAVKGETTIEQLYLLPYDDRKVELVGGWVVREPLPGGRHGRVAGNIISLLNGFVRPRRLGIVYTTDAGYLLSRDPDTLRGPDVSFLSMKRFDEVGDTDLHIPGPPDLAVEVVSRTDRPNDIHAKVADYLAAGTPLVWVVYPATRKIAVHRHLLAPKILGETETLSGEDVLPGFSVSVGEIFAI